jgi:hypothetical protein
VGAGAAPGLVDTLAGGVARISSKISHAPRPTLCGACTMSSSDDVCWRLAGECGRWADEAQDRATREAFRQMAKVWAQLAFGYHYKPPSEKADENGSPRDTRLSSPVR